MASAGIEDRATFQIIRYANCWEDADILYRALSPGPGGRILSIASAGDNSFALAAGGAEVLAADLSGAQLALAELKRAALYRLDHDDVLGFLGIRPSAKRRAIYDDLRARLPRMAQEYWDARRQVVEDGVVHAGKFERYFQIFRRWVLALVHPRSTVLALLDARDRSQRAAFYENVWNNRRWRTIFAVFFSQTVMGRLGRDPEFFRYVDGPVSQRILSRVRHALIELPTHDNPYLEYILTGNFGRALPRYLRPENFEAVRRGLDRITFSEGPIEEVGRTYGAGGFSGFNLSDIFEYMDEALSARIYGALLALSRPGARLAYWNMLVPRRRPAEHAARVDSLDQLADQLLTEDRAFFYSRFVVEEVAPSSPAVIS
jgi:S-adenosylmethionine-diacylglycerol 3-amino-3-carboxypropyl transferase